MAAPSTARLNTPQAFICSYAPRIRSFGNALLTPVVPPVNTQLSNIRTTKRGTTAINYAEDGFEEEDLEDSEGPRRPTGLRSLRREEPISERKIQPTLLGKELDAPVNVQGIWREWMTKNDKLL